MLSLTDAENKYWEKYEAPECSRDYLNEKKLWLLNQVKSRVRKAMIDHCGFDPYKYEPIGSFDMVLPGDLHKVTIKGEISS